MHAHGPRRARLSTHTFDQNLPRHGTDKVATSPSRGRHRMRVPRSEQLPGARPSERGAEVTANKKSVRENETKADSDPLRIGLGPTLIPHTPDPSVATAVLAKNRLLTTCTVPLNLAKTWAASKTAFQAGRVSATCLKKHWGCLLVVVGGGDAARLRMRPGLRGMRSLIQELACYSQAGPGLA